MSSPTTIREATERASRRLAAREARKAQLLDTAWGVIEVEGERVSMDRIAAAAGITRPILYRHFGDIGGLYLAVAERFAARLFESFAVVPQYRDGRALLAGTIEAYTVTIERYPGVYRYLTRRQTDAAVNSEHGSNTVRSFVATLGDNVSHYLRSQQAPDDVAAIWGHTLVGAIQAAGDHWLDTGAPSREELGHILTDLLWRGFGGAGRAPQSA